MTARARLDADRTAEPLTRIEHHPPRGGCIGPYMPLVNPEYVDENGKRTPLSGQLLTTSEVALAKSDRPFPMPGTTWRWLGDGQYDPRPSGPHTVASLRWARGETEVVFVDESSASVQHLMGAAAWENVPMVHDLTTSEVALAKVLAAWEEWAPPEGDYTDADVAPTALDGVTDALDAAGLVECNEEPFYVPNAAGRALLDRARKAGVLVSRTTDAIRELAHMFGASSSEERTAMSRDELLAASIALLVNAGAKRWGESTHDSLIYVDGALDHEDGEALRGAGWTWSESDHSWSHS